MTSFDEDNLVGSDLASYLADFAGESPEPARSMEKQADDEDFPIVGPLVGRFLKLFTVSVDPELIVELGSGFGYSAYWFGQGAPEATIHLTDWSSDNLDDAQDYLNQTDSPEQFEYHSGDATKFLDDLQMSPDLVFLDLDKKYYPETLDLLENLLPPGGWLLTDNVLWSGKVADESVTDKSTQSVRRFNSKLRSGPWETSMLPLRDGIALSRRTEN